MPPPCKRGRTRQSAASRAQLPRSCSLLVACMRVEPATGGTDLPELAAVDELLLASQIANGGGDFAAESPTLSAIRY